MTATMTLSHIYYNLLLNRVEQGLCKARTVVRVRHARELLEHGDGVPSTGVECRSPPPPPRVGLR